VLTLEVITGDCNPTRHDTIVCRIQQHLLLHTYIRRSYIFYIYEFTMAASMRRVVLGLSFKFRRLSTSSVRVANALAVHDTESLYPPIKPRYPPGQYGGLTEECAWDVDAWSKELLAIPKVKERLESIAGSENRFMWIVEALDRRPRNIEFRQRLLRTHVVEALPGMNSLDETVSSVYERLRPALMDHIRLEWQHQRGNILEKAAAGSALDGELQQLTHHLVGGIVKTIVVELAASNEQLLRSQLDEDVRVETFWYVGGFTGEGNKCDGQWQNMKLKNDEDAGILMFQYRHRANWQIRTELPLPEVCIDMGIDICHCINCT